MGKADMTRDYYADLEVQPTADLIEIKKQFKKLALKWHPDRNPGKEAEVNAKFQTIQSAHEILTDEAERRRYDAGRLRTTRFSGTTGGTRGNPYANAGAQWAPPPKPFGTPRARAAEQGTSGASRYQKFNTDGPFRSTPNKPPDQETRKNFYEGFERMKKTHPTGTFAGSSKTASPNRRPPPPPPPNVPEPRFTSQSGREESNKQRYPPGFPPQPKESKPGHDEWNSGERRSPRKNGFMPGNATFDEPAAPRTSSGYSNGRPDRPSTASSSKPPDPPPRPKGFERFQDPAGPIDGAARQSTPYATHGGEKTNPFESSNIHRSKTTRERPSVNVYRSSGSSSPNTRDKHRSASPPRSVRFGKQSSTFETNGESPPKRNYPHSKEEGSTQRSRTRFKASVVSDTSSEDEYSEPQSSPDRQPSGKNLPRRGASANNGTDNSNRPNVNNDKQRKANPADFRNMANSGDPLLNDLGSGPTGNQRGPDPTPQPIFPSAYRSQPSAIPPLFTSNVETFDTTFETGKWNGQFGADSFVNPSEFSNGPSRTRAGSRSGRKSPTKARSNTGRTRSASASLHSESAKPEQVGANNAPRDSPTKPFAPEEWADPALFNPSTFAPPTPQGPSRPPFSQRTPSRKGSRTNASRVSKTAGGKSAVVEGYSSDSDDEIEHPNPSASAGNSSSAQAAASSPNAMDIDSPSETTGGPTRQAGEVRNVPLEPSRPEWRSGATNGDRNTSNFASQTPGGMPNVKVHQDDDLKTNFEEFKNVDPFFQPAHGLDSFNDIKSTLPFESMPANNIPLNSDAPTRAGISIPVPPPPPKVPSRPLDGAGRMSMASWQSYALSFQTYYAEFDHYNRKMEAHIVARREQWDTLMNTSGWGWLESRSDKVFNEWATNSKHDTLVKEKWAEAAKNHDLAMGEFQTVRGSMCGKTEN